MIRLHKAITVFSVLLVGTTAALSAASETPKPFEAVRTLQKLQDAIAQGDMNAFAVQEKLITQTAEQFRGLSVEQWKEPRNFRAAVVFVFSGGPPDAVEKALEVPELAEIDKKLLEGAIAFANGRKGKAAELLSPIDPRKLPPSLGGNLALVQSMLTNADNRASALQSLQLARWLMPGTLVEESALRRAISVAAELKDTNLTDKLADIYMWRFSKSVYARYFAGQFAEILTVAEDKTAAARLTKFGPAVERMPKEFQLAFYLSIAREAVSEGKQALTLSSTAAADHIADEASSEKDRAQLYSAALMLVHGKYEESVAQLKALDASKLAKDDAELLASALSVAEEIRRWPKAPAAPPQENAKKNEKQMAEAEAINEILAKARKALSDAEEAEKRGSK